MDETATKPLGRLGKIGIVLFVLFLLGFGAHVEQKSAFLTRRMGDLDVFLRAAWAVRNDADLYAITSDNDWHYLYPPLYAILMMPLADPPRGADPTGYMPYAVSVAICYLLNLFSLFFGVHLLASALEERVVGWQGQPRFCRRWWALRLWPILICFLPIGHTLMRGQVNTIVLAALCAAMAGWIREQKFRAGLWLSLAICIKVIPLYLLVYPLWKRDGRSLLGCAAGCLVGLVLIPGIVFGPTRAVAHYETYAKAFLGPYLKITDDDRSKEEIATTDSIGVKSALHNWMYPGLTRYEHDMHPGAKLAYLLLGFGMTFITLWPGTIRQAPAANGFTEPTQFASLILLMAIFSPVCHMHYLLFCLPIVMTLLARTWHNQNHIQIPWPLMISFAVFNVSLALAHLPGLEVLKELCAALFGTLPLWGIPVVQLWTTSNPLSSNAVAASPQNARVAA